GLGIGWLRGGHASSGQQARYSDRIEPAAPPSLPASRPADRLRRTLSAPSERQRSRGARRMGRAAQRAQRGRGEGGDLRGVPRRENRVAGVVDGGDGDTAAIAQERDGEGGAELHVLAWMEAAAEVEGG